MGAPQSGQGPSVMLMNTLSRTLRLTVFSPDFLESRRRQLSVSHRVLDIAMAEIRLERSRVVAPVCKRVTALWPGGCGRRTSSRAGPNRRGTEPPPAQSSEGRSGSTRTHAPSGSRSQLGRGSRAPPGALASSAADAAQRVPRSSCHTVTHVVARYSNALLGRRTVAGLDQHSDHGRASRPNAQPAPS